MPDPIGSIFAVFLRLGLTSFGGPIAHLGYYRTEFVERRRWLSEAAYADLVALCQLLPGPASSQVGFAVGLSRGGLLGGVAAGLGFTLPSAVAMVLFAQGAASLTGPLSAGMLHGLQVAAVAVVAQAVWSMAVSLCPDRPRATIAVVATLIVTAAPTAIGQIAAILAGAAAGAWLCREVPAAAPSARLSIPVPRGVAIALPGLLLVVGVLPFWASLGRGALMRASLRGVNAAVVGVLLGALYDPVWTKGIGGPADFALALVAFALLVIWKAPPWLAVLVSAAGGAAAFGR